MGENNFASWPVAMYGFILMLAGSAYYLLTRTLISLLGPESKLATAVGRETKGMISIVVYMIGILLAFANPVVSCGLYFVVAVMWLVPDKRIERALAGD
jgi:uncharacterized membrane protein